MIQKEIAKSRRLKQYMKGMSINGGSNTWNILEMWMEEELSASGLCAYYGLVVYSNLSTIRNINSSNLV